MDTMRKGPNWRQVALFTGLTFVLSWGLNLVIWLTIGYQGNATLGILLQLQMLLPAFSAILLGQFVFRDSRIYHRKELGWPRIFFWFFLVFTLIFAGLGIWGLISPVHVGIAATVIQLLTMLGLLLVIALRLIGGQEKFAQAGLAFGKIKWWLLFGLGFIAFYAIQTALNYLFGLGETVDVVAFLRSVAPAGAQTQQAIQWAETSPSVFLLVSGLQTVLLSPLIVILISFGEEYGWRGFLQGELVKLGRIKGVLLVGLIWGVWHAPIVAMGHNYPGYPVTGPLAMVVYSVGLAFVLGYAMLKSGSVWLAAFLHGVNNQVLSFLIAMVYKPADPMFSFGIGLYGLLCLAVVVGLILIDPVWRRVD